MVRPMGNTRAGLSAGADDPEHPWRWISDLRFPTFNHVETNPLSTSVLARGLVQRQYLTVGYLVDLLRAGGTAVSMWAPDQHLDGPLTFLGLHQLESFSDGAEVIMLERLIN